ncbi:MAG: ribosomal protein S18-alanine N-acetyltransferase [Acholeplasmataceae bacterium]
MIRNITTLDIFQVVALETNVLGQSLGAEFLYQEILYNPYAYYLVYEKHKEIVGYVGYRLHETQAEMMNFVVKHEYQHQGIGTELFSNSVLYFNQNDITKITLEVRKNNKKARSFYEKLGFKESHRISKYYENEDAIIYFKEV